MVIKELKITNSRGDSITFGRNFRLPEGFKLSGLGADVNYASSTADGSHYQNSKLKNRDFDIPFFIDRKGNSDQWIEDKRNESYKVFNPSANPMRIDLVTIARSEYFLNANLEGAPTFLRGFENDNKSWLKGLLQFSCGDPYIYESETKKADIALWIPSFDFPLEITSDEGIEMGYRSQSLIVNVLNNGQSPTGMIIRFRALGTLLNPMLLNVNTYEQLKLNTKMIAGDVIEVSTYRGIRSVMLTRNNSKTNVFNTLDLQSVFLQLEIGDNLFRYDADEGLDNLEVSMIFNPRRIGV